jgi:hypothetical protein
MNIYLLMEGLIRAVSTGHTNQMGLNLVKYKGTYF